MGLNRWKGFRTPSGARPSPNSLLLASCSQEGASPLVKKLREVMSSWSPADTRRAEAVFKSTVSTSRNEPSASFVARLRLQIRASRAIRLVAKLLLPLVGGQIAAKTGAAGFDHVLRQQRPEVRDGVLRGYSPAVILSAALQ